MAKDIILEQDLRLELADATLAFVRDENGSARLARAALSMLCTDRFWAFGVDLETRALAWQIRAGRSQESSAKDDAFCTESLGDAAQEWMVKLAKMADGTSVRPLLMDASTVDVPIGAWETWTVLADDNGTVVCVGVGHRSPGEPVCSDPALLGVLARFLAEAFTLRARLRAEQARGAALSAIVDHVSFGVVLLDDHGRIGAANPAARAILAAQDGLQDASGTLTGLRERDTASLRALLHDGAAGARLESIGIERRSGARPYGIVHVAATAAPTGQRAHGMLISDSERPPHISPARVRKLFNLTPAESVIAARLAMGDQSKTVARQLDITMQTLRVHLRSIFQKTGVRRQTELVILILRSVAALVSDDLRPDSIAAAATSGDASKPGSEQRLAAGRADDAPYLIEGSRQG